MTAFDSTFKAAIPGMSIAHHKLGEMMHERPPKFVDKQEALEYFWKQFHRPEILKQIWYVLEKGVPVRNITSAVLYKACSLGIIQMNLGIVISPTISGMIMTLGKAKGIQGIKLMPKMRNKVKDQMMNDKLNEKLGHKHGQPIPQSALRSMQIPKAQDLTNDIQTFLKSPSGKAPAKKQPEPTPKSTGILGPIGEG